MAGKGRPTNYSVDIAAEICGRMSEGQSIKRIAADENMPCSSTIFVWLQKHNDFVEMYEVAAQNRAHLLAEESLEIADDGTNDWMERQSTSEKGGGVNTGWVLNGEHVQRSRLRVDTRKWFAARLNPRKYGDKVDATISGGDKPVEMVMRWATTEAEGTSDPSGE